jgi:hypothetical protein
MRHRRFVFLIFISIKNHLARHPVLSDFYSDQIVTPENLLDNSFTTEKIRRHAIGKIQR